MPITPFEDPTYLEAVYAALLALLQSATFPAGVSFNRVQRVIDIPDSVPPADQPALLLVGGPLKVEQKHFSLAQWTIRAIAVIYARADGAVQNQTQLSDTLANYLIWGVANAITGLNPSYQKQTLGGLVYHCWLEGEVIPEIAEQQIVITMPIYILAGSVG